MDLETLLKYGIHGKECVLHIDCLFALKLVVSYNDCLSSEKELYSGLPQGSILGPVLLIILVNDISDVIRH